jgi:hypothetical protein
VDETNEAVVFPEDLSALSADELTALQSQVMAEFDALAGDDDIDDAGVTRLETLANGMEQITAAHQALEAKSVSAASRTQALAAAKKKVNKLRPAPVKVVDDKGAVADSDSGADDVDGTESKDAVVASSPAKVPSLVEVRDRAPAIPATRTDNELTIVAAAPASGIVMGQRLENIDTLVAAVQSHARSLVTTSGRPGFQAVATIQNRFEHVVDGTNTKPGEIEEIMRDLRSPDRIESLVAAGGWCAPSETRYDFFNIACEDGMVDLPTIGITRGGLTWPVSPSLADVYTGAFTNATNPWVWTETDDIAAVTGSPTKPCVRVPCADFDEARLECYGICLTAGNLTDSAFPEATRNYLSLLLSAHYHAMNARYIGQMVTLSTAATTIPTGSCRAVSSDLPDFVGLAAQDYRTRYGMCDDDVLEVLLPRWARDAIRSDLSRRTGIDPTNFSNADIDNLFSTRRVRIQWVSDWQVRSAGQPGGSSALLAWPDTLEFLIYAAGTFVRGNGLTLDLGVVRDSVLNETNDHTAAWTEECHLIARMGHESRRYSMPVCVGGLTGGTCSECHVA